MVVAALALGALLGTPPETPAPVEQPPAAAQPDDPYSRRPVCDSMFLASDWQLSAKQGACDWIENGVFSTTAFVGAAWSATSSPLWNRITRTNADNSYGFAHRFAIDFGQNAFKATGAYLGGLIFHEDPRVAPPYLIMRIEPEPHGFWPRTVHALAANLISYRCDSICNKPGHITRTPALSRLTGSLASGASLYVLDRGGADLRSRAIRGAVSAYAATFANSLFVEFKPELSAFAGRVSTLLGVR